MPPPPVPDDDPPGRRRPFLLETRDDLTALARSLLQVAWQDARAGRPHLVADVLEDLVELLDELGEPDARDAAAGALDGAPVEPALERIEAALASSAPLAAGRRGA